MAIEFKMPDVGEGITEGEIVQWLVSEGANIKEDDPIVEVQTDKAIVQIPSPAEGVLLRQGAAEGTVIEVGSVLAVIGQAGEAAPGAPAQPAPSADTGTPPVAAPTPAAATPAAPERPVAPPPARTATEASVPAPGPAPSPVRESPSGAGVKATPAVRHRARELGVNLAQVRATGPNGRVTLQDVESFARDETAGAAIEVVESAPQTVTAAVSGSSARPDAPRAPNAASAPTVSFTSAEGDQRIPLRGLRRTIARRMVESVQRIPHVTTVDEAEVSALVALRGRLKPLAEARGVHLTYLPFVMKAVAAVLREFPYVNASLDDKGGNEGDEKEEIVLHGDIHIGMATATPDGLMVPVIRFADRKSVLSLAAEIVERAERARARTSTMDELRGSTFSITNIGSVGGLSATPIINPPEVAILGVYRILDKPIVKHGAVVPGKVMGLTLTFDHRLIDGEMGARFLRRVAELLENPDALLLEMA